MHRLRKCYLSDSERAMFFVIARTQLLSRALRGFVGRQTKEFGLYKTLPGKAFGIAAGLLVFAAVRAATKATTFKFSDKVVVISGGSRGLGLLMARRLGREGAKLVLLARDEAELQIACEELSQLGVAVTSKQCDVTDEDQVKAAVDYALRHFGRIDVLINNAGVIQVGPMDSMTNSDYKNAIDTHFWGPMFLTEAVLPSMRENRSGRIVNIASVGGNVSVPHLLPYCVSKFALRGFSEGITSELRKENIFVTTVCPGLMRTGSHVNALFKGQNKKEYAWFSIGNALPFFSTSGDDAANEIVEACRRGDPELIITLQAQVLSKLNGVLPGLTSTILQTITTFLPGTEGDGSGTQSVTGRESQSSLSPSLLTVAADSQVEKNNESRN